MDSAARALYFTGIYIFPPLLTVLEASLKLKIANIYPLALCSVFRSSDILYARLTYVPNCNVVILSLPVRTYQFLGQAEPWVYESSSLQEIVTSHTCDLYLQYILQSLYSFSLFCRLSYGVLSVFMLSKSFIQVWLASWNFLCTDFVFIFF
jgi:hypothetical protein